MVTCLFQNKGSGVASGFVYSIGDFNLYCKELLVDSDFYKDKKNDPVRYFMESMIRREETFNLDADHAYSYIDSHKEYFNINHQFEEKRSKTEGNSITLTDKNNNLLGDQIHVLLQKYINPYAESISYLLLYFLGFMPPVSIFKSHIRNKIYLIVDQVP